MSEPFRTRQEPLFVETLEEAVEATAAACGGKKAFACKIRPELADDPEAAHRWLLDALNPDRRTELHAHHLRRACVVGRDNGCHILKHWFDDATGYKRGETAPERSEEQVIAARMVKAAQDYQRAADELAEFYRIKSHAQPLRRSADQS